MRRSRWWTSTAWSGRLRGGGGARLGEAVSRAISPRSPGGAAITAAEMERIMQRAFREGARYQAKLMQAAMRAAPGDRHFQAALDAAIGSDFGFRNGMGNQPQ